MGTAHPIHGRNPVNTQLSIAKNLRYNQNKRSVRGVRWVRGEILQQRYAIEEQLGKKAGRRTLLARDLETQELVIVKLLTFSSDFAWEDLKLFQREAETLKALKHPTIPRYIDYFELDSAHKSYALVQSYVKGKSLEEHMGSQGKFTEKQVRNIAEKLLEILIFLHQRQPPVIHRDIKPSNIILADCPYLVDFGSVQTLASRAGKTITVVGTYGYMPPEQFGGYASPATDLYSLGATLIALAAGIHPADLPQEDMAIAFKDHVNLSPSLVKWLGKMTETSLERRFSSAEQALASLKGNQLSIASKPMMQNSRPVNTFDVLWSAIWRSVTIGGGVTIVSAAIYSTVVFPVAGTLMGAIIGAFIGVPIGLVNGFLVAIITRIFFFPLKKPLFHRRTVNIISMVVSTAIAILGFQTISLGLSSGGLQMRLFWVFAPAIITGLSMGVASKFHAQWYEEQVRLRGY
ncbi:MAG: serine/threonine-protein kinase [Xenococcaceae cyanobacterium MO_188.B19]|nr:serine/threonine-protein kinase [Xenococcaceae cyanobacterium MO_188.B19]